MPQACAPLLWMLPELCCRVNSETELGRVMRCTPQNDASDRVRSDFRGSQLLLRQGARVADVRREEPVERRALLNLSSERTRRPIL